MFDKFGIEITIGTIIIVLLILYFIIKWAVKNGVKEAYDDITGKETYEDKEIRKQKEEIKQGIIEVKEKRKEKKQDK